MFSGRLDEHEKWWMMMVHIAILAIKCFLVGLMNMKNDEWWWYI
jgi:hypothetical protein